MVVCQIQEIGGERVNTMTPFAYSISDYDEHKVYPTLAALVAAEKSIGNAQYYAEHKPIQAHFPDGTYEMVGVQDYINVSEVNEAEVAAYIDDLRETARKRDQEAHEEMIAEGQQPIFVTGCLPLYMGDRDSQIKWEIAKRKYSWK